MVLPSIECNIKLRVQLTAMYLNNLLLNKHNLHNMTIFIRVDVHVLDYMVSGCEHLPTVQWCTVIATNARSHVTSASDKYHQSSHVTKSKHVPITIKLIQNTLAT